MGRASPGPPSGVHLTDWSVVPVAPAMRTLLLLSALLLASLVTVHSSDDNTSQDVYITGSYKGKLTADELQHVDVSPQFFDSHKVGPTKTERKPANKPHREEDPRKQRVPGVSSVGVPPAATTKEVLRHATHFKLTLKNETHARILLEEARQRHSQKTANRQRGQRNWFHAPEWLGSDAFTDEPSFTSSPLINPEDRFLFPYSATGVVLLFSEVFGVKLLERTCTASVIGPRLVLTAASCLYDRLLDQRIGDYALFLPAYAGM